MFSSLGRFSATLPFQGRGQGFESPPGYMHRLPAGFACDPSQARLTTAARSRSLDPWSSFGRLRIGGVETNMAVADGVVYVPVVDVPTTYSSTASPLGVLDLTKAAGEMVAIDIATGKQLWDTKVAGAILLGGATVSN